MRLHRSKNDNSLQGGMSHRQIHRTRVKKEPIPMRLLEFDKINIVGDIMHLLLA
jgi:hypothetical protein